VSKGRKPTPPSSGGGSTPAACTTAPCPAAKQICPGHDDKELQKALDEQAKLLQAKKKELETWDGAAKDNFKKWFGTTDEKSRKDIQGRVDRMIELNKKTKIENLKAAQPSKPNIFAYVYPNDKSHTIYIDTAFCSAANTGQDSRAGTLCHEMSHFNDIGATKDHIYGADNAKKLAKDNSTKALSNADNFEYYMENVK
jgi:hypothetical protein